MTQDTHRIMVIVWKSLYTWNQVVWKSLSLKPDGRELEVADYWNCGFIKFCKHFSHKTAHLGISKEKQMHIPLLSMFAVLVSWNWCWLVSNFAFFPCQNAQWNPLLLLWISISLIQLDAHKDFTQMKILSLCRNLWSFTSDPYTVWWRLFLAYETSRFWKLHIFIAFWMGFPHTIILNKKFRRVK